MSPDPDVWPADVRPVIAALLSTHPIGAMLAADGWTFTRFERNGDMAPLPFLRATRNGYSVEAPLVHWDWVEFQEPEA